MRRTAAAAALFASAMIGGCRASSAPGPATMPDSLRIRQDIEYLASPALAGRLIGTPGNDSAAAYIARRYAALDLRPLSAGYLQHFVARPPVRNAPSPSIPTQNVMAEIPGRDPAVRGQVIVVGAHFDHLGRSTAGAMDPDAKDAVRRGADDNASGTAAVMELARRFAASPAKRSIIVANFSGEEQGLLGSAYFVDHLPVPVDSVDAMVNFDMVGRLRNDRVIVYGVGTATELPGLLAAANQPAPLQVIPQSDGYGPSDQSSFYAKNIPVLHFFTDLHDDYHSATDTPEKINAAGEVRVVDLAERVVRAIADAPARLTYVRQAAPSATMSEGSDTYLGSIPDMAGGDSPGLRLTGVRAGSPADVAGLKPGDVIVEFDGKLIKDIYTYSDALFARKPGDRVDVVVMRDGQRLTLHVTLGRRGG
jgi:Zn-dependent M28 family amino/carboxypeptidase